MKEHNAPPVVQPDKEPEIVRPLAGSPTDYLKKRIVKVRELIDGSTDEERIIYMREILKIEAELKIRHYEQPDKV